MFELAPLGLVAAAMALAAAVPIFIHLLHRQRTQPVLWGAMQFLKESPLQQKRRKKVDHWLLMLLRVALMVLLVGMIFWPRVSNKMLHFVASEGATDYAFVIDHSLSTGRRSGEQTVYQQSLDAVSKLGQSGKLKAADTVSFVLAEHAPQKVTALPVGRDQFAKVVDDLRKLKPGLSDASIPDAIQSARELVSRGRNGHKVVLVLSDEQRAGWKVQDLSAWSAAVGPQAKNPADGVKVFEVPIPFDETAANITVGNLTVSPEIVGTARPSTVKATLINNGSKEVGPFNARLIVTGKEVARQQVPALAVDKSQEISFEHTFTEPNSNWVEVNIDVADGQPQDNSAVASAYVWQSVPVLVIDGAVSNLPPDTTNTQAAFNTFRGSQFLQNALLSDAANPDAPPLIKPTVVSFSYKGLEQMKLEDYSCVIVNDVPLLSAAFTQSLRDYCRSGHGVWFILGKNTDKSFAFSVDKAGDRQPGMLSQAGLFDADLKSEQNAVEKAPALDVKDPLLLTEFTSREKNSLVGMNTYKWWSVKPTSANTRVVLATEGGDPLILDREMGSNGGRVVVWTTPVDRGSAWNNWTAMPSFPPLVNLTVYHLSTGQTKGMRNRKLDAGAPIVWTGPGSPTVSRIDILRPDGSKVERRPITRDGRQVLSYSETFLPGRYELRFDQTAFAPVYFGVGINPGELDKTVLSADDRAWLTADDHKYVQDRIEPAAIVGVLTGGGGDNNEVWKWIAGGLLLILLGETYVTYRMVRRQAAPGLQAGPQFATAARA